VPTAGGTYRLLRVVGVGSAPIDLITGEFHASSSFRGTHVGNATVIIDGVLGDRFTAVVTTPKGDELHIESDPTNSGGPLPTDCPTDVGITSGPYSGAEFIVGGTGRFSDAMGYITFGGCFSITADTNSPTGFTFAFDFLDRGWIKEVRILG
jgi:hypothetical protein